MFSIHCDLDLLLSQKIRVLKKKHFNKNNETNWNEMVSFRLLSLTMTIKNEISFLFYQLHIKKYMWIRNQNVNFRHWSIWSIDENAFWKRWINFIFNGKTIMSCKSIGIVHYSEIRIDEENLKRFEWLAKISDWTKIHCHSLELDALITA